jgi:hypothetical protein
LSSVAVEAARFNGCQYLGTAGNFSCSRGEGGLSTHPMVHPTARLATSDGQGKTPLAVGRYRVVCPRSLRNTRCDLLQHFGKLSGTHAPVKLGGQLYGSPLELPSCLSAPVGTTVISHPGSISRDTGARSLLNEENFTPEVFETYFPKALPGSAECPPGYSGKHGPMKPKENHNKGEPYLPGWDIARKSHCQKNKLW